MKRKIKAALSVIMCVAMIIAVIPSSAFAADADKPDNYVEIKFKEGCSENPLVGETTEIYVEYETTYKDVRLEWSVSGACTENSHESITDSETGNMIGMKINAVSIGYFYATVKMVSYGGYEIAKDTVVIRITEPDTRTEEEKRLDELEDLKGELTMGLYMFVIMPIVSLLAVPVLAVMKLLGLPPF